MSLTDRLVHEARALVPSLAKRAAQAEVERRVPPETLDDVVAAGFFSALAPARFGGLGAEFSTVPGVGRELARGCPSTAWVVAFLMVHNWFLAQFPEETQLEVFGDRGFGLAPAALSPTGRAEPVEGGYVLNGRWAWGTGVLHSDWVLVNAHVAGPNAGLITALLPIDDVVVHDVWHTEGMRATGSNDIEADDAYVPLRRTVAPADIASGVSPGQQLHDSPLYRCPSVPMLCLVAASAALGAAEAAVELFEERLSTRVMAYSSIGVQALSSASRVRLASASADARAAASLFDRAVRKVSAAASGRAPLSERDRADVRLDAAHVVALSRGVLSRVLAGSGASVHFLDSPFQRLVRDVNTLSGHIVFDYDRAGDLYTRVRLGLDLEPGELI